MSYIKKVIETLGGWKKSWSLLKPSTSTTVMAAVLFILVIFFPEHQWKSQESREGLSQLISSQTQQVEETQSSVVPLTTTSNQTEDSTGAEEPMDTSTQNVTPTIVEKENDSSYDQENNETYTPQSIRQESAQNTPDNAQGLDNGIDEHNGFGKPQDTYSEDQKSAPEGEEITQSYGEDENNIH